MAEPVLERRVDRLEHAMADLARSTVRLQDEMRAFKDEMSAFKDEMRAFKDEMSAFKDEMRAFKDEMSAFKDEMRADRDEMRADTEAYKAESRREIREMRRQWGELSKRLGTMAEDLVAPSVGRIVRTVIGCPEDRIESVAVRVYRRSSIDPGRSQEFDVVAVCGGHVLVNETKTRLIPRDVDDFVARLSTAREYLPEAAERRVIGAIASLYVDPSLVRRAEKHGLIVLGFGEDVMDVLNSPGFVPREF
jgi:hypothetical protein